MRNFKLVFLTLMMRLLPYVKGDLLPIAVQLVKLFLSYEVWTRTMHIDTT